VLTHADLRGTARIRAVTDHLVGALGWSPAQIPASWST
jgi:hypothetical protein